MRSARVSLACVALLLSTAGCGGKASVNQASAPCETRVPATHPADTLTVVVFDKIDMTHAPWPRNREERFVFSHLYETLVTIDCRGEVEPALAKSWTRASDGWYIELKEDAHFWDDTMVTAADIQSSLKLAASQMPIGPADIVDETHAIIHGDFDIKLLALPMLAICKQPHPESVPVGTGVWQFNGGAFDEITMRPAAGGAPVVRFELKQTAGALDILNGSADAMITDDPSVLDYARTKKHVAVMPMAWDKAYVLIDPRRAGMDISRSAPDLPRAVCDGFARDAVAVDARGGSDILTEAERASPLPASTKITWRSYTSKQVLFDSSDPTARALAERIVALAAMDTSTSAEARALRRAMPEASNDMRTTGLRQEEFAKRFKSPGDAGYVVPLSWNADFPALAMHLPYWVSSLRPLSRTLIPLVETRAHLVAISDRISYVDDKKGTVHITPPGMERVR